MFKGLSFHRLHRYILNCALLASVLIYCVAQVAWDLHGLISFIRWMWTR